MPVKYRTPRKNSKYLEQLFSDASFGGQKYLPVFLAHLSRRLTGELIVTHAPASVVRPSSVHNFKDLLL